MSLSFLRQHYLTQPHEISFETLALCNAACSFCPYPTLKRKGAKLSMDLITHLIGQMKSWTQPFYVTPFKVNEPLLDGRLAEICAGIESELPLATIRLFTNGSPLTAHHIEWIGKLKSLDPQFGLWISLNSCDPIEYGELMKLSYAITQGRLDRLHDAVVNGVFPHQVTVSRVLTGTDGRLDAKDMAFQTAVRRTWPKFTPFLIKRDGWIDYVEPSTTTVPRSGCQRWFELNITAVGKAVLCCMTSGADPEHVIGDVSQQSLLEVYNQPHLQARRLKAIHRDGIAFCERCTY